MMEVKLNSQVGLLMVERVSFKVKKSQVGLLMVERVSFKFKMEEVLGLII